MSRSAVSIFLFGIYLLILGVCLISIPDFAVSIIDIDPVPEPWGRIIGIVIIILSIYYLMSAKDENREFFFYTVFSRPLLPVGLTILVYLEMVKPGILILGGIEFFGAAWTWLSLRSESKDEREKPIEVEGEYKRDD